MEIPQVQFLDKFDTPVMLARCRVLFDKVVDVPVVAVQWGSARAEDSGGGSTCASGAHPRTNYGASCRCPSVTHHGMMEVERSSWLNRCVLRGCAGVDVVRHAFHLAQILRAQAIRSQVSSRSVVTESIHGSLAVFPDSPNFLDFSSSEKFKTFPLVSAHPS